MFVGGERMFDPNGVERCDEHCTHAAIIRRV